MSGYFNNFPKINNYKIHLISEPKTANTSTQQKTITVSFTDFFRNVGVLFPRINDAKFYYDKVDILDGERPDQLSYRLYGTPGYYWTFFLVNDALRLGESLQWPLSDREMNSRINDAYEGRVVTVLNNEQEESKFLYDKFVLGETVSGSETGITGTVGAIRPEYGQIIIRNISGATLESNFREDETLTGETSGDSIQIDNSVNFADAVYKYFDSETGREVNNDNFINISQYQTNIGISSLTFRNYLLFNNDRLRTIRALKSSSLNKFTETVRTLLKR